MTDRILIDFDKHVAYLRLNRPDKLNAIDLPMLEALNALPERLAALEDLRAVVVTGAGRSFCAGLDFASFAAAPELLQRAFEPVPGTPCNFVQHAALCWRRVDAPVIAAIEGHCFGGGLQIALGADLRIAAPSASLSVMEIRWGIIPDMGITRTLKTLVPIDVAKELTFTGRAVEGTEAHRLGLVTRISDDPVTVSLDLAARIARQSPDAIVAAKKLFDESWDMGFEDGLALEAKLQLGLLGRPNQMEAVQAGLAQREAKFNKAGS